jgi:hypothetical protein
MAIRLSPRRYVSGSSTGGDVEFAGLDFQDILDGTEVLTGTPTVTEVTTGSLTLTSSDKILNASAVTILGRSVAANKAVQFSATNFTAGTTYEVRVVVGTNATPARTFIRNVIIEAK